MPAARLRPLLVLLLIVLLVLVIAGLVAWFIATTPPRDGGSQGGAPPAAPPSAAGTPAAPALDPGAPLRFRPTHATRALHLLEGPFFSIGYDEERRDPAWVTYDLAGPVRHGGPEPSRPIFATDFRTAAHVAQRDYNGSHFDRGHMCPAYAMWSRHGEEGFLATFTMANVIPQPHGLNAGLWEDLETAIAGRGGWAERLGPLSIIDGPVFAATPARLRNGTAIPDACFMVVVQPRVPRALAWIVPDREDVRGPAERYLATIHRVEQATGLDLFAGSAAALRPALEDAQPDPAAWR